MAARGPQNGRQGLEISQPYVIGPPEQLSLIMFVDSIIPSNLKNPKWPQGGFKMVDGVWKGTYS